MPHDINDQCADIQPQLAAYALGEVDADTAILDHLAACPACQQALRAYVQVARLLPYDTPEVTPPPELRERILAAVANTSPGPRSSATQPPATRPGVPARRRLPALWPALAFAIVACLMLLGWNLALQRQLAAQSAQLAASRESWQTMIALLNDPEVRWYAVAGDVATGHVWTTLHGNVACLVAQHLPPLGPDQVYQVWLIHGDERTSGGIFQARDGNGWIIIRADEPLANYDAIGVTIEPQGGSPAPTGQRVLRGELKIEGQG